MIANLTDLMRLYTQHRLPLVGYAAPRTRTRDDAVHMRQLHHDAVPC